METPPENITYITSEAADSAMALSEKKFQQWRNKVYDERAADIHKIAVQLVNRKDKLSIWITIEMGRLLALSGL